MRNDNAYLLDILESAKAVLVYVAGKTREDFLKDPQCQDAVIRRIEIIGEAARRVSNKTKAALPLPWSEIISMRNLMRHEYDDVDLVIVWGTAKNDLPSLIDSLKKILKQEDDT